MTGGDADAPARAVPPSIVAIMAAIGREVAQPAMSVATDDAPVASDADAPPAVPPAAATTLSPQIDAEARALLAPMLQAWLDAHLPEIVEIAVHAELRRLTGQA